MSNLKYAIIEDEIVTATVDSVAQNEHPKPYLVGRADARTGALTSRVEAALDVEFANGSMPA